MRHLMFGSLVLTAACASSPLAIEPQPTRTHQGRATTVEDRAVLAAPVGNGCGDTVLSDQLTSGGLGVTTHMPCWNYQDEVEHDRVVVAVPERTEAVAERQATRGLAESEIAACAHIPLREREHSPFAHRRSISEVMPYFEAGVLRGVRVVFKPVAGLTAEWMRQDIACHRAHVAVLGMIPDEMFQDPTLVQDAEVSVIGIGDRVTVVVRTDSADQAALALAKAQGKGPSATMAIGK